MKHPNRGKQVDGRVQSRRLECGKGCTSAVDIRVRYCSVPVSPPYYIPRYTDKHGFSYTSLPVCCFAGMVRITASVAAMAIILNYCNAEHSSLNRPSKLPSGGIPSFSLDPSMSRTGYLPSATGRPPHHTRPSGSVPPLGFPSEIPTASLGKREATFSGLPPRSQASGFAQPSGGHCNGPQGTLPLGLSTITVTRSADFDKRAKPSFSAGRPNAGGCGNDEHGSSGNFQHETDPSSQTAHEQYMDRLSGFLTSTIANA